MQWYVLRKNKGSKETVVWQGDGGGDFKTNSPERPHQKGDV